MWRNLKAKYGMEGCLTIQSSSKPHDPSHYGNPKTEISMIKILLSSFSKQ